MSDIDFEPISNLSFNIATHHSKNKFHGVLVRFIPILFISSFLFMSGCGAVHQQQRLTNDPSVKISSVRLQVPEPGEFTVFYERATATTAPAMIFGLVGAAVASASNSSADAKLTNEFVSEFESTECSKNIQSAFVSTLEKVGKVEATIGPGNSDAILTVKIENCGFRIVDQQRHQMAAFVDMYVKLTTADGLVTLWDDRESTIGLRKSTLADLQADKERAQQDFIDVLTEAGEKAALKISYM